MIGQDVSEGTNNDLGILCWAVGLKITQYGHLGNVHYSLVPVAVVTLIFIRPIILRIDIIAMLR